MDRLLAMQYNRRMMIKVAVGLTMRQKIWTRVAATAHQLFRNMGMHDGALTNIAICIESYLVIIRPYDGIRAVDEV